MTASNPMTDRCGSSKKRGAGECTQAAGWGTDHPGVGRCKLHGGASPQAQMTGVIELARRESVVMGQPLPVEPHEAILECIRVAAGEVQYASDRIAELKLNPTKAERKQALLVDTMFGPQLHVWVTVRQKAMDRLVMYSATALKAGVEERLVTAAERYAQEMADSMRRLALALGHDPAEPKTREAMRAALTLVTPAA